MIDFFKYKIAVACLLWLEISGSATNYAGPQNQNTDIRLEVWPMYFEDKKTLGKI